MLNPWLWFSGTGLAGMRQRDLIQWYVGQQNAKNSYSSMEEAAAEVTKLKAIIEVQIQIEDALICMKFLPRVNFAL